MMTRRGQVVIAVGLMIVAGTPVWGVPSAGSSVARCQKAVQKAAATFVVGKEAALGKCLQAIAKELVEKGAPTAKGAAALCIKSFRALQDSRGTGKSLPEKLRAAIAKACDPAVNASLTHTLADVLGPGAGVAESLDASNVGAWCAHFGGDGGVGSVAEWISCIENAQECGVATQLSTQYPRALEWLGVVRPAMNGLAPGADPQQVSDALAGLDAVVGELRGPGSGGAPQFQCGNDGTCDANLSSTQSSLGTCTTERGQCMGADLPACSASLSSTQGQLSTCSTSLGTCQTNLGACQAQPVDQAFPATGQTTCWDVAGVQVPCAGTGQDGEFRAGAPLAFIDNGDGTITDLNTHLMWEKKSCDESIHDQYASSAYPWAEAFSAFIATLNVGSGFANHTDWRLPNLKELESIVDFGHVNPSVSDVFNNGDCNTHAGAGCQTHCTVLTCSCTHASLTWSSTSYTGDPTAAFYVGFYAGNVVAVSKSPNQATGAARAVRGPL